MTKVLPVLNSKVIIVGEGTSGSIFNALASIFSTSQDFPTSPEYVALIFHIYTLDLRHNKLKWFLSLVYIITETFFEFQSIYLNYPLTYPFIALPCNPTLHKWVSDWTSWIRLYKCNYIFKLLLKVNLLRCWVYTVSYTCLYYVVDEIACHLKCWIFFY